MGLDREEQHLVVLVHIFGRQRITLCYARLLSHSDFHIPAERKAIDDINMNISAPEMRNDRKQ